MRRLLIFSAFFLSGSLLRAQQVIDVSKTEYDNGASNGNLSTAVNGLVYSPVKFVRVVSGTPFFKEEWMKGILVPLDGGKAYGNLWLRLNLMDNQINYKNANGQEMIASTPIKYITLIDSATGAKYDFVQGAQFGLQDNALMRTFFQVLVNDKVSLVRQINKKIHEAIAYGTATSEQDIVTVSYYYVRMNGNFIRFKWDDWQEIFKDKKDPLSAYIKTNHLKGKTDEDFTKLVQYYNTL